MAGKEGWVDIAKVAVHLEVTQNSIYLSVSVKRFLVCRVSRLLRFKLSEVDECVKSREDASERSSSGNGAREARRERMAKGESCPLAVEASNHEGQTLLRPPSVNRCTQSAQWPYK